MSKVTYKGHWFVWEGDREKLIATFPNDQLFEACEIADRLANNPDIPYNGSYFIVTNDKGEQEYLGG